MPRSQLAINCPAPLLERLRGEAQRQGITTTALVIGWLQAGLDGRLEASSPPSSEGLEQRLAALEARLEALAAAQPLAQHGTNQHSEPEGGDSVTTSSKDRGQAYLLRRLARDAAGAITTGELAEHLGVKRNALNERLRRAGGAAIGLELEGWRCVGRVKPARGGPAQWQWRPAG